MIRVIDAFLNTITMYRIVLYGLMALAGVSLLLGTAGLLFYSSTSQFISLVTVFMACYFSNWFFAKIFKVPANVESAAITALILFFLLIPATTLSGIQTLIGASLIAMASKYFFVWNNSHIFNPAAFAAFMLGLMGNGSVLWWVGSGVLFPFVLILGLLIVRKVRRFSLFFSFLAASFLAISLSSLRNQIPVLPTLTEAFISWPLIFFGTVMLTEPLTLPPTKKFQMMYGVLVGFFFGSQFEIGPLYPSPELALLVGNVFAFLVSPKQRFALSLRTKEKLAEEIYQFTFAKNENFTFTAGQYMEWTLPHHKPDSRGNRRYFTLASSPTEKVLRLIVRIGENSSSYKRKLLALQTQDTFVASQRAGDFVLPKDATQKLVFIAGGIGVTPFLSMIRFLLDTKDSRDIVFFYGNKKPSDIVFSSLFEEAKSIGLKTQYVLTSLEDIPPDWQGLKGRINQEMIMAEVPDYTERVYYLSGPSTMVDAYKTLLLQMGISRKKIITDYFPGF